MTLKEWMRRERLTVNQLARKMGITKQSIHKYLRGGHARKEMAYRLEEVSGGALKAEDFMKNVEGNPQA